MDRSNKPNRRARVPSIPPLAYHKFDKFSSSPTGQPAHSQINPRAPPAHLPNTQRFSSNSMPSRSQPSSSHRRPRDSSSSSFFTNSSHTSQPKSTYTVGSPNSLPYLDPQFSLNHSSPTPDHLTKSVVPYMVPTSVGASGLFSPKSSYNTQSEKLAHLSNESSSFYQDFNFSRIRKSDTTGSPPGPRKGFLYTRYVRNLPVKGSSPASRLSDIGKCSSATDFSDEQAEDSSQTTHSPKILPCNGLVRSSNLSEYSASKCIPKAPDDDSSPTLSSRIPDYKTSDRYANLSIAASSKSTATAITTLAPIERFPVVCKPIVWKGNLILHHQGFAHEVPSVGYRYTLEGRKELDINVSLWPRTITILPSKMELVANVEHFLTADSVMWYVRFSATSTRDGELLEQVTAKVQAERLIALIRIPMMGTVGILGCSEGDNNGTYLIAVHMPFFLEALTPMSMPIPRDRLLRLVPTPLALKHRSAIPGRAPKIWTGALSILGKNRQLHMNCVAYPIDISLITDDSLSWPAMFMCKWHTCVGDSKVPNSARWCAIFRSEDPRFPFVVDSLLRRRRAMVSTTSNGILYLTGRRSDNEILGRFLVTRTSATTLMPKFGAIGSKC